MATEVLAALDSCTQIKPFTSREPAFDLERAYEAAGELRRLRVMRGEKPLGRKIGFTNQAVWAAYGIGAPIWGDMYDSTIHELTGTTFALPRAPEMRIEPEIIFKLAKPISRSMDDDALLGSIQWIAHGFEIVHSLFPDWRFKAADAVADAGVHTALLIGPTRLVDTRVASEMHCALRDFEINLCKNGAVVDKGRGANVLGGPITALNYLVEVLARDHVSPSLRAGEIITTGTLTRAFPVAAGEQWSTTLSGIDLEGLRVELT